MSIVYQVKTSCFLSTHQYKGISQRSFQLSLRLDENVEVQKADYENGLLKIDLQRNIPEEAMPRQIPIGRKTSEQKQVESKSE